MLIGRLFMLFLSACLPLAPLGAQSARAASFEVIYNSPDYLHRPSNGALVRGPDDSLYGVAQGYANGIGAVFRLASAADPKKSTFEIVYSFADHPEDQGRSPLPELAFGPDGAIYGVVQSLGTSFFDPSAIFRLSKDDKGRWSYRLIHRFSVETEGNRPTQGLTVVDNGDIYGATTSGGPKRGGVIFRLTAAGEFTALRRNEQPPSSKLIVSSGGDIVGTFGSRLFMMDATRRYRMAYGPEIKLTSTNYDESYDALIQDKNSEELFAQKPTKGMMMVRPPKSFRKKWKVSALKGPSFDPTTGSGFAQTGPRTYYTVQPRGGASDSGLILQLQISDDTASMTIERAFQTGKKGVVQPLRGLTKGADGCLYGASGQGGKFGQGALFRYCP